MIQVQNVNVTLLKIIKRVTCFSRFELCFETQAGYIYFFFSKQIVKSNCYFFFLKFFPIIFPNQIYSFPVIIIYKRFNFCNFFEDIFFISSRFNATVTDGIYFCIFLSNQEKLYMIHHNSDLPYDIYSTTNEHNRRQTHYLSSTLNNFDIYF